MQKCTSLGQVYLIGVFVYMSDDLSALKDEMVEAERRLLVMRSVEDRLPGRHSPWLGELQDNWDKARSRYLEALNVKPLTAEPEKVRGRTRYEALMEETEDFYE